MPRKYEREYRKFKMTLSAWLKKTQERIEMLPEMEKLNQLSYEQWCEVFKENYRVKDIPAPPPPPLPRILKEGSEPPPPPKVAEPHSCKVCTELNGGFPPDGYFCNKKHVGLDIYKTNNCTDFNTR